MIFSDRKQTTKIYSELEKSPITFDGAALDVKEKYKCLGDILDVRGESECITSTINARKGLIYNTIHETIAIIEDSRMQRLGGLQCGLDIWEVAIIPSLLSNSGSWSGLRTRKNTIIFT